MLIIRMAFWTVGFHTLMDSGVTPLRIGLATNRFEVVRIDTPFVLTQMVDVHARWNMSNESFVGKTMSVSE